MSSLQNLPIYTLGNGTYMRYIEWLVLADNFLPK